MLEAYRTHVEERAAQGIPPLPLTAEQVNDLVALLKAPPAGEEEMLLDLLTNRVPPGVDEAAYVKAGWLLAVAKGEAENVFQETLKSLFALSEAYPELKADQNFLKLQEQLHEIENNIEYARRYYNAVVRDYNTLTEAFPSNIIASYFSFHREAFFELKEPEAREPVKVSFD